MPSIWTLRHHSAPPDRRGYEGFARVFREGKRVPLDPKAPRDLWVGQIFCMAYRTGLPEGLIYVRDALHGLPGRPGFSLMKMWRCSALSRPQ